MITMMSMTTTTATATEMRILIHHASLFPLVPEIFLVMQGLSWHGMTNLLDTNPCFVDNCDYDDYDNESDSGGSSDRNSEFDNSTGPNATNTMTPSDQRSNGQLRERDMSPELAAADG